MDSPPRRTGRAAGRGSNPRLEGPRGGDAARSAPVTPPGPATDAPSDPPTRLEVAAVVGAGQPPGKPKLLARVRAAIQTRQYSPRTEDAYVHWIKRYIFFHKLRHPDEMSSDEIQAFLSDLAVRGGVSASTQNQALAALVFMYKHVLGKEVGWLAKLVRAKRPRRLPVVLTPEEVDQVLAHLEGVVLLICRLLYGSGMRLLECLGIRVKDLDFQRRQALRRREVASLGEYREEYRRGDGG